jgi:hypothetical protein
MHYLYYRCIIYKHTSRVSSGLGVNSLVPVEMERSSGGTWSTMLNACTPTFKTGSMRQSQ